MLASVANTLGLVDCSFYQPLFFDAWGRPILRIYLGIHPYAYKRGLFGVPGLLRQIGAVLQNPGSHLKRLLRAM